MKKTTPWRLLFQLFRDRFFESDTDAPDSGFTPNLYQVMGFLATPGLFISVLGLPALADLARMQPGPMLNMIVHMFHLFLAAYSSAVVAFATVFEWNTLFPDKRDFLILGPFPLPARDIFTAKIAALGWFLAILVLAVNGPLAATVTLLALAVHRSGFTAVATAQIACSVGASMFGFVAVAAFQGLSISILSPRAFRRLSPWLQAAGMSLAVVSLLLFPVYSQLLVPIAAAHPRWLWYFPPVWFAGIYDLLLPHGSAIFTRLGVFAFEALAGALAIVAVFWTIGFRRHFRRTLESEDTASRKPRRSNRDRWFRVPEEIALFRFSGWMLARSAKHKLFLATYFSAGLSLCAVFVFGVNGSELTVSDKALRGVPFLIQFIVLSGLRAGFQFPVDLQANWLFQITENHWSQIARRTGRTRVLVTGLIPMVVLFIPMSAVRWGIHAAFFDAAVQCVGGALWVELLFWTFETVPFTRSYFQGKTNLVLLAGAYIYGIRYYCFGVSAVEVSLEHQPLSAAVCLCAGAAIIALLWSRRPAPERARFNASEPVIQTLDLS